MEEKDREALLELMKAFDICYPVSISEKIFFFPWFVEDKVCPNKVDIDQIFVTDDKRVAVSFNCVFFNRIPQNVFEMMCVRLQKLATENHYQGDRIAWKDGLVVHIWSRKCLILRDRKACTIRICIQGEVEELVETWMTMHIYNSSKSILDQWHGVLRALFFLCSHCQLLGKTPAKKLLPDQVFLQSALTGCHVACSNDECVPKGLVFALTEKSEDTKAAVMEVKEYVTRKWKAKAPPVRLRYVDCLQESPEMTQLSWTLPSTDVMGVVLEYRTQEGQWERVDGVIEDMNYDFTGVAEEFRVAAANQNGLSEFLVVKACPLLLDEVISDCDRDSLDRTYECFCTMSSLSVVTSHLVSRGALSRTWQEQISRTLKNDGPFDAAVRLMEYVYRMSYRQLYYFKKSLKETNQNILAKAVPVRLLDRSKLAFDNV